MIKWGLRLFLFFVLVLLIVFVRHFYLPACHEPQYPTYNDWDSGKLNHILPSANHSEFLIKTSFAKTLEEAPLLIVSDSMVIRGESSESSRRYWSFHATDLQPNTEYKLILVDDDHNPLADGWPLSTYPHPDSTAEKLTILAYTCAGGVEDEVLGREIFIKTAYRQQLLSRGLSFDPDIVIANGDHIYWDRKSLDNTFIKRLFKLRLDNIYGHLDLDQPMTSQANLETLSNIADAQIAELYGCLLRSKPVYFLTDDHDLFENDEAREDIVTFPPQPYMMDGAVSTQSMYYPEFLTDRNRPQRLTGQEGSFNRNYGTIRYGNLLEGLLYDAKRYSTLTDDTSAVMVARDAEAWIADRTVADDTKHLLHIPSSPIAWTAGKWSEWYPDVLQADGSIATSPMQKHLWQSGWWSQHQRLLNYLKQSSRTPIILQGDLHNLSYALIRQSGDISFEDDPIHVVGTGPLGSGAFGFPSSFRGTGAVVPEDMQIKKLLDQTEKNGFSIIEVTVDQITISMYAWRPDDGVEVIADMEPLFRYTIRN